MSKILVTGATGNIGSRLVTLLTQKGKAVRAFARDAGKLSGPDVEAAPGDFTDTEALRRAMDGVSSVYLLSVSEHLADYEANALDAARAAGVGLVVTHSVAGAQYAASDIPKWHHESEERVAPLPATRSSGPGRSRDRTRSTAPSAPPPCR